ncbi:Hypothetical protein HVR_LOCUS194 [uncultured virus]|nr:Hypothetical protein HVR_LOCUS194 [uncultured virus]
MVRFYAICLDAFPETPLLKEKLKSFQRVDLVCAGAFTTATMTSIISGTVGSQIIPGGIGYNTTYKPTFLEWRKHDKCLTDLIIKSGQEIIIHNHVPWMSHNIIGYKLSDQEKTKHYRDHTIEQNGPIQILESLPDSKSDKFKSEEYKQKKFGIVMRKGNVSYSSTHPDITLNTFVGWGSYKRRHQFYSNEAVYYKYIRDKFNGLFWTDLCHWHEAVYYPKGNPYHNDSKNTSVSQEDALSDSIRWLNYFDFNDPDSVFFIYADHSHRVEPYLDPPGYITWGYWKDNRAHPQMLRPVISSYDLYPLILSVLGINIPASGPYNILGELPTLSYNPNRIYYTEDGRADAPINDKATVFGWTQLVNNSYVSVINSIPGSKTPGIYMMITDPNNNHSYYLWYHDHDDNRSKSRIISESGLTNRIRNMLPFALPNSKHLQVAINLGWRIK